MPIERKEEGKKRTAKITIRLTEKQHDKMREYLEYEEIREIFLKGIRERIQQLEKNQTEKESSVEKFNKALKSKGIIE